MIHRGPDGEGYADRDGCALGFRRLAIIDPQAPAPPFGNETGTIWSVCNGEVYNGDELRDWLIGRGHVLRTGVDTEILPHLYEEHGLQMVEHLEGMFAFAVWDPTRRTLLLGRDRAGEKPLYYCQVGEELIFASEIRALLAHPRAPRTVDPIALRRYLLHDFFPAPLSPIQGIRKLPAGHVLVARAGELALKCYWDLAEHFGTRRASQCDPKRVAAELDERIAAAVRRRKRSDVPVGVFLSGGIDSSTILAHLAEQEGPGVPVFSLGHREIAFDETRFARETAQHFDAQFEELVLDEADLADGLRRIGDNFDEPLGDASTIPTHLLALHASRSVKVILSGEGADELFAGYPTYIGNRYAELYRRLPRVVRNTMVAAIRRVTPVSMGNVGLDYILGRFLSGAEMDRVERHHTWFGSLAAPRQTAVLSTKVLGAIQADDPFASARERLAGRTLPDGLAELLYTDFTMYLQDDLLTKVDRATMLASIEARAPFLDRELVEFAAGLPSELKLSRLTTKAIIRRAVKHRLPPAVLARRKRGFNIPFSRWVLHGLGEQLRRRFAPERVRARGLLSPAGVAALLDEHMARTADHRKPLFTLLALDMWCDSFYGDGAPVPLAESRSAAVGSVRQ